MRPEVHAGRRDNEVIDPHGQRHADQLRALAPAEVIKERKTERDKARWSDHNTGEGYRLGNEGKRATARLMASQGATVASISRELQVGYATAHRWTRE